MERLHGLGETDLEPLTDSNFYDTVEDEDIRDWMEQTDIEADEDELL